MIKYSDGALTTWPDDAANYMEDGVKLRCSTDLDSPVIWKFKCFCKQADAIPLFTNNEMVPDYKDMYEMDRGADSKTYNLEIKKFQPSDSGEYICIDSDGQTKSAQVLYLGESLICIELNHLFSLLQGPT